MTAFDPNRWRALDPLLDEALDREGADREAWLCHLAEDRPDDARDLRLLLADHAASARLGFLAGTADSRAVALGDDALAGQTVGNYTLETIVGQGGMGSVWRARRSDGRYQGSVAIKLLNVALIGKTGSARFQREGRILAQLTHPHIARLIDAGVTVAGQPYLAIEFVEGVPIDRYCDAAQLDIEARIRLFLDVLGAVAHSHAHLIVHRDLKPLNVLVDGKGSVKLLDFGIAKLLEGDGGEEIALLTQADGRILTPEYAAPEQVLGGAITTATDIYALGVLLYLLLSGRHPMGRAGNSPAELIRAVTDIEPPCMSAIAEAAVGRDTAPNPAELRATSPDTLRRQLRGDLDNIVAKAMQKDPQQRYATAEAFADDLKRHLERRPVAARADTVAYRVAKFAARNRGAVAAGVLIAAAIVVGIAGTLWQARRAEQLASQAQVERDRALRQLSYAEASDNLLAFLLSEVGDKPFTKSQLLARGETSIEAQFADDPALRTRMLLMLADLYGESMEQDRANAVLERAQLAASGVQDASVLSQLDCARAERLGDQNGFERAMPLFERAIARMQGTAAADRAVLANCLLSKAQVEILRGDAQAARSDAEASLAAFGHPRPGQEGDVILARSALAEAAGRLGDEAAAVAGYEQALAELKRLGRDRNPSELSMLAGLGLHLSRAGQWRRAAEVYRHGLVLAPQVEGGSGVLPAIEGNFAKLLSEFGDTEESTQMFTIALTAAATQGHSRSVGTIDLMAAPAWCAKGDLARCRTLLEAAERQLRPTLPPGHTLLAGLAFEQGRLAMLANDPTTARQRFAQAAELYGKAQEVSPNRLRAETWLARAEAKGGDLGVARTQAERAVAQARTALGGFEHSVFLGEALLALGEIASLQGDQQQARTALAAASTDLNDTLGADTPEAREAARLLSASH